MEQQADTTLEAKNVSCWAKGHPPQKEKNIRFFFPQCPISWGGTKYSFLLVVNPLTICRPISQVYNIIYPQWFAPLHSGKKKYLSINNLRNLCINKLNELLSKLTYKLIFSCHNFYFVVIIPTFILFMLKSIRSCHLKLIYKQTIE